MVGCGVINRMPALSRRSCHKRLNSGAEYEAWGVLLPVLRCGGVAHDSEGMSEKRKQLVRSSFRNEGH